MKLSLYLPTGTTHEFARVADPVAAFETVRELAVAADESGFHGLYAPDHFIPFGPGADPVFEVWTTLAALATQTRRIRLGQLVTGNGYRNPALQAKMASTLDVISGGRLTFGIGAGWYGDEYTAFGYEFPSGPERLRQLGEAVRLIRALWTEPVTTFDGKYYQVREVVNQPAGVQRPHIPLMIAGGGEQVTLKLVARYGDLCNVQEPPDEVARKYAILARHCEAVGRDFTEITKTSTGYCIMADTDEEALAAVPPWAPMVFPGDLAEYGLIGTAGTIRKRLAAFEDAGVDELIVGFHDALEPATVRRFAAEFIG
ncbi:TIGR03560 family F420-dependent LLM class oxidoreductase [Amycolatopsis acidiphila]|uniref:TIGR03560 family F420-dependent LLM class oxidoreductase n=1 Tax=Amycolatopsis acidiphila TaxID=715473 RepID=A0A558A5H9_9PSEU|nr:TIGR03560 family F420-dependent LLM class oxidoreductase [Amycolatopsis acidiphila]TVT19506.1 TIGR03560 family F420-dependent LLM class oxidoreductase [Amycolatopsis acidiphila]UIJ56905.1 TIGR03560 family F420-dependent LLM class oxidoreductase [Amycolatopsis acidiphila]GHG54438.1 LLM class F420-dependent oxidoreductase [Amycolatopsis acidiphila]